MTNYQDHLDDYDGLHRLKTFEGVVSLCANMCEGEKKGFLLRHSAKVRCPFSCS